MRRRFDRQNVMVAARDGTMLATDIYRPGMKGAPTSERLPVLLHRTPYDKSEAAEVAIAETLAKHGYVVMVQDTRGRHRSQGVFEKYSDYDAYDGYDAIEWAASRPYCDGQVGMYGTSYAAHTQADASQAGAPASSCAAAQHGRHGKRLGSQRQIWGCIRIGPPTDLGLVAGSG